MNTNVASRTNPALATNPKKSGPLYVPQDRKLMLAYVIGAVGVVILLLGAVLLYNHRSAVANQALSDAMRTFQTPVVQPGQPVPAGERSFPSSEDRARAANTEFAAVANHYGMTPAGRNALYLQGVTAMQIGQTSTAEELLKKSASSWNSDVASMAKLALANLYHGSNRDAQAIEIYQKLTAKPTTAVPAGLAQLQLADLYNSEGKKDQARKIYAQIKDKDPKSAAAEIATQDLGEAPAR
ncbi:tetratricopeptide repeat protein [Terriglobus sp.]|uniref:tetratricopeptide repeat protein n=1 Tax=Terriglobus sp. TaxID=1889013 RepID=UPI003B008C34